MPLKTRLARLEAKRTEPSTVVAAQICPRCGQHIPLKDFPPCGEHKPAPTGTDRVTIRWR